ncbi:MAG: endo-1,4-beta-xylanase, partial [Chthoniobacterales bacterium]
QQKYQAEYCTLFNFATLPFYWGAFEAKQGVLDYPRLDRMAEWCAAHGITAKGHPLIYHEVWPAWASNNPDEAIALLHGRVTDLIRHYKTTIAYWDVINEVNCAQWYSPSNGECAWIDLDGPAAVVETSLSWARTAAREAGGPPKTFLYNDFDTSAANLALLSKLQADGKLPDAIGIQSHMHAGTWPLTKVWQVCEAFGKLGKPLHFTEVTVLSGTSQASTPEGEARQADYVTQFYTLLFSHPSVHAISWWDMSDHDAWKNAPAGLLRSDMSPKPAYTRLQELIHTKWWTKAEGMTGADGIYSTRAFYGDYQITVTAASGKTKMQSIAFPEGAPLLDVTISLP